MNTSPILHPPVNPTLRKRLEVKLQEYKARKDGVGKPWELTHPKARFRFGGYRDAHCKVAVLSAVLAPTAKPVRTYDISLSLLEEMGTEFDEAAFNNACTVVESYLDESGQMPLAIQPGTGLPTVSASA